jgi:hypothetical protein
MIRDPAFKDRYKRIPGVVQRAPSYPEPKVTPPVAQCRHRIHSDKVPLLFGEGSGDQQAFCLAARFAFRQICTDGWFHRIVDDPNAATSPLPVTADGTANTDDRIHAPPDYANLGYLDESPEAIAHFTVIVEDDVRLFPASPHARQGGHERCELAMAVQNHQARP